MKPMTCDDVRIANQFAREGEDQHFIPEIQIPSDLAAAIDELGEIDDQKSLAAWRLITTDDSYDQAFVEGYRMACLHIAAYLVQNRNRKGRFKVPKSLKNFIHHEFED